MSNTYELNMICKIFIGS